MGDMEGGGGVKNLKKVRDVLCERPQELFGFSLYQILYFRKKPWKNLRTYIHVE